MRGFSGRGDWELVSSCGTWAYILHGLIPRPGIELVTLARQGRFLTSGPSAKPLEVMSAHGISKCSASILFCVAVQSRVMGWGADTEDIGAERRLRGPRPLSVKNEGAVQAERLAQGKPSISGSGAGRGWRGWTTAKMLPGARGGLAFAHSSGTDQIVYKHNNRVLRRAMKSPSEGPASLRSTRTSRNRQELKTATTLPDLVFGENIGFFWGGNEKKKKKLLGITYQQLLIFSWVERKCY